MKNTSLENYLGELELRLKHLTSQERQAQLREVRGHLELLSATLIQQGHTLDEAMRLAMQQFGAPECLGRELNQVAMRKRMGARARWIGKAFSMWCGLWLAEFAFFSSMNNRPTDFPYLLQDRVLWSAMLALPALFGGHLLEKAVKKWKARRAAN